MSAPTIEAALVRLAEDRRFSDYDMLGHSLAERVGQNIPLTAKQRRAAYRMLRKYTGDLAAVGLNYSAIPEPVDDTPPTAQQIAEVQRKQRIAITVEEGRIHVRSPYRYKDVCKGIPAARWNKVKKCWTYPASATSAAAVRAAFVGMPTTADETFRSLADEAQAREEAQRVIDLGDDELPDVDWSRWLRTPPWTHQQRAILWAAGALGLSVDGEQGGRDADRGGAMLALEMGVGKSLCTVALVALSGAEQTVILSPLSVLRVWTREFAQHPAADFHVDNGLRWSERSKRWQVLGVEERKAAFEELFHECRCGRQHVAVINYEAAWREPFAGWARGERWDWVICDESQRIKSASGVMSKFCHKLGRQAARRLALTGTPMPQGPLDIFGQFRFLDPDVFGLSYTSFARRYAQFGGYQNHEIIGYVNQEELNERFYSRAYRVGAEVLDLPPERDVTRTCILSRSARKTYDDIDQELIAELDEAVISTPNVLVKLLRMQQITGGSVNDDTGTAHEVDHSKEELLEEVLTEIDASEPVVVFCRFVHDLTAVARATEKLGRRYGELSGRRNDLGNDAKMPEGIDVMGVQIQSGGVGIDLTRAAHAVYYSLGYSLGDYVQSRARLVRPGQERSVLFIHLVAQSTKDEDVYDALSQRKEVIDHVLETLGRGRPPNEEETDAR